MSSTNSAIAAVGRGARPRRRLASTASRRVWPARPRIVGLRAHVDLADLVACRRGLRLQRHELWRRCQLYVRRPRGHERRELPWDVPGRIWLPLQHEQLP